MSWMEHINRANVGNNNGEILNQFNWDIKFIHKPIAVYWPGDNIFKIRLVNLGQMPSDVTHDVQQAEVGGNFTVLQTGHVTRDPYDLTMEFQDYEDNRITKFARDWYRKCEDPVTKLGYPKRSLYMDLDVYQLTNARKPVKVWHFKTGLISTDNTGENFGRNKEVNGKVTLGIRFEWWDDEIL